MANSIELKAIITAVDRLSAPLKGMRREMRTFKKEFSAGLAGAAALGAGVVTAMAGPIKQAIDFESTLAEVRKVVDFDTPVQFKQMADDILALSTQLPMAANGIGQIVAAGGQAGIAQTELMSFAQSAVKMGVAFDQTAAQSGQMMAQWRTAFRLTQTDVVSLADKINYLGNTGPANAANIAAIVTRIGPLGEVAGLASGEIAALGATIAGMGVESDVAATGIKNFMLALTKGSAATKSQKIALQTLNLRPETLATQMQQDAKGAMLQVLKAIQRVPKAKQTGLLNALFGTESLAAIAPLLSNLPLLEANLEKVADKQQYGGSMQKEYAARAATTANALQRFKNQMQAASISIGSLFLPAMVQATKTLQPLIDQFHTWVKAHPALMKSVAKWALYLLGTATAVGVVTRAFRLFNHVMRMSTLGKLVSLLVIGGGLVVDNWQTIGPIVQDVWRDIDGVIQAIGGWEQVLKGLLGFVALTWSVGMVKSIKQVTREMKALAKNSPSGIKGALGKAGLIGGISMGVTPLIDKGLNAAFGDHAWFQNVRTARDWQELGQSILGQSHLIKDKQGEWQFRQAPTNTLDSLGKTPRQDGEVRLIFENAPTGMRVAPESTALSWLSYDVGYTRFAKP